MQIVIMYLANVWLKRGGQWEDETTLQVALSADHMITPFGAWLLSFPGILVPMTHAVLWSEAVLPLAVLLVIRPWWLKTAAVCVLMSLHAGIAMSLKIGIFAWVNMSALLVFVPPEAWAMLRKLIPSSATTRIHGWALSSVSHPRPSRTEARLSSLLASILLVVVVTLNVARLSPSAKKSDSSPAPLYEWLTSPLVKGMRLDQRWLMYAPSPSDFDGWFVLVGTLSDGREIDIFRPAPVSWEKPSHIAGEFSGFRERKFFMKSISSRHRKRLLSRISELLAAQWNAAPPKGEENSTIVSVDAYFVVERTRPPSAKSPGSHYPRERKLLSSWSSRGKGEADRL